MKMKLLVYFITLCSSSKWLNENTIYIDTEILPDTIVKLEQIPSIESSCYFEGIAENYTLVSVDGCSDSPETLVSIVSDKGIEETKVTPILSKLFNLFLDTLAFILLDG